LTLLDHWNPGRGIRRLGCLMFAGFLLGCSNDPDIVPCEGTVLIDGKPLEHGFVQVVPKEFRPATGKLGPGGKFKLTTTIEGDGCAVGTHPVGVIGAETLGANAMKWHAPQTYRDFATSGLSITVVAGGPPVEITLSWNGEKPFIEKNAKE